MGNILKMDFTVMRRYLYFVAFYAAFFPLCFQNNMYIGTVIVLSVYIFVIGGISVEERDKIHMLHRSLPVKAGQIVGAKYLESLLVWAYATVVNFIVFFVLSQISTKFQLRMNSLETVVSSLIMLMLFVGLSMHFVYKFGYMKARIFIIILWIAGAMLFPVIGVINSDIGVAAEFPSIPYFAALVIAAAFYVGSWLICIRVYQRKSV